MFQKNKHKIDILVDCSDCQKSILNFLEYIKKDMQNYKYVLLRQLNDNLEIYKNNQKKIEEDINNKYDELNNKLKYVKGRLGI